MYSSVPNSDRSRPILRQRSFPGNPPLLNLSTTNPGAQGLDSETWDDPPQLHQTRHVLPLRANLALSLGLAIPIPHDPNLLLPAAFAGLFLLYLEFNLPGKVLPGALGILLATLAAYGLAPLSLWAVALAFAAVGLVLGELLRPTRNALPALGTMLLAYALFHLQAKPNPGQTVHLVTAILTAIAFTRVTLYLGRIAVRARRNKRLGAPGLDSDSWVPRT